MGDEFLLLQLELKLSDCCISVLILCNVLSTQSKWSALKNMRQFKKGFAKTSVLPLCWRRFPSFQYWTKRNTLSPLTAEKQRLNATNQNVLTDWQLAAAFSKVYNCILLSVNTEKNNWKYFLCEIKKTWPWSKVVTEMFIESTCSCLLWDPHLLVRVCWLWCIRTDARQSL